MGAQGYDKSLKYLRDYGYQAYVTINMETLDVETFELFHKDKPGTITVRKDAAKRLMPLLTVVGPKNHYTAIMEFNKEEA